MTQNNPYRITEKQMVEVDLAELNRLRKIEQSARAHIMAAGDIQAQAKIDLVLRADLRLPATTKPLPPREPTVSDLPARHDGSADTDPLYGEAVALVCTNKRGSISFLQRKLRINWDRAQSLFARMVKENICTGYDAPFVGVVNSNDA